MNTITRTMNNNNHLISIVIPAYNAASRIKFTLESIINQDYENLEIILVNDASLDETELISSQILSASQRPFRIITHEHNKGVSASRNTGLKNSSGRYICFIDADDMIEHEFISKLHEVITRDDCEIVFCGIIEKFSNGRPDWRFHSVKDKPYIESGEKFIIKHSVPSIWCCMYDLSFLRRYDLLFHEGCISGEDIEFTTKAFCRAGRVTFTQDHLYIYIHHEEMGSVRDNDTREKKLLHYESNSLALRSTAEYLAEHAVNSKLKRFAEKILIPQSVIRQASVYAMKDDKNNYDSLMTNKAVRERLRLSQNLYTFVTKPEVFLKAFAILNVPNLYYRIRSR